MTTTIQVYDEETWTDLTGETKINVTQLDYDD